jgi:hypothetical protein
MKKKHNGMYYRAMACYKMSDIDRKSERRCQSNCGGIVLAGPCSKAKGKYEHKIRRTGQIESAKCKKCKNVQSRNMKSKMKKI